METIRNAKPTGRAEMTVAALPPAAKSFYRLRHFRDRDTGEIAEASRSAPRGFARPPFVCHSLAGMRL